MSIIPALWRQKQVDPMDSLASEASKLIEKCHPNATQSVTEDT